jgi:hypothetical protein
VIPTNCVSLCAIHPCIVSTSYVNSASLRAPLSRQYHNCSCRSGCTALAIHCAECDLRAAQNVLQSYTLNSSHPGHALRSERVCVCVCCCILCCSWSPLVRWEPIELCLSHAGDPEIVLCCTVSQPQENQNDLRPNVHAFQLCFSLLATHFTVMKSDPNMTLYPFQNKWKFVSKILNVALKELAVATSFVAKCLRIPSQAPHVHTDSCAS